MNTEVKKAEISDAELEQVAGGVRRAKKFKCPRCGQVSMIMKFKMFKCTNPACGYEQKM